MITLSAMLGRQLAMPSGAGGRLIGHAMRIANRRVTRLTVAALAIRPGDAVLDLGCGTGDSLGALLESAAGGPVHGVDHAPDMVRRAASRHPRAIVRQGRFDALPFPDDSIDRVLACNVAYFWSVDTVVLAEIDRVLRPGGMLALYVTDAVSLARAGLDRTGTHRLFDATSLARMLGPTASIHPVRAGFGATGWLATRKNLTQTGSP